MKTQTRNRILLGLGALVALAVLVVLVGLVAVDQWLFRQATAPKPPPRDVTTGPLGDAQRVVRAHDLRLQAEAPEQTLRWTATPYGDTLLYGFQPPNGARFESAFVEAPDAATAHAAWDDLLRLDVLKAAASASGQGRMVERPLHLGDSAVCVDLVAEDAVWAAFAAAREGSRLYTTTQIGLAGVGCARLSPALHRVMQLGSMLPGAATARADIPATTLKHGLRPTPADAPPPRATPLRRTSTLQVKRPEPRPPTGPAVRVQERVEKGRIVRTEETFGDRGQLIKRTVNGVEQPLTPPDSSRPAPR